MIIYIDNTEFLLVSLKIKNTIRYKIKLYKIHTINEILYIFKKEGNAAYKILELKLNKYKVCIRN